MTKNKHLADSTNPDRTPRFLCPGCGEEVEVLREHFGRRIECPSCRRRFKADVRKEMKLREQMRKSGERQATGRMGGRSTKVEVRKSTSEAEARTTTWPNVWNHIESAASGFLQLAVLFVMCVSAAGFFLFGLTQIAEGNRHTYSGYRFQSDNALGSSANSLQSVLQQCQILEGLLCLMLALLICALIQFEFIRRALQRREMTLGTPGAE